MSSADEARVDEDKWEHFSLLITESLPPGTMVALLGLRIVQKSDATPIAEMRIAGVGEPFMLRVTSSLLPPDTELELRVQFFTPRMDPASSAPSLSPSQES
jgi:hypothetical protein